LNINGVGHSMKFDDDAIRTALGAAQLPALHFSLPWAQKTVAYDLHADQSLKGELRQVHKNSDIVVAGRCCRRFFLNHEGWLFRYRILHNGDRQIVDFILPGQIFGLQACFFESSPYSIGTATHALILAIPLGAIDDVFERDPKLAKALFWSAVCEAAIVGEHLIDAARRSAYERISHLILELFLRLKTTGHTNGMSFNMPLTQELIADALGLTMVHVNRTLRQLRDDGLIKMNNKCVTLLDFDALSLVSDFDNSYLSESVRALRSEIASAMPTI
jgi:CRP-like cAMP-binding protein